MKKVTLVFLALLLVLVLPTMGKSGALQTSLVPQNTQWLLHFDMQQFISTRLGELLLGEENGKFHKASQYLAQHLKMDPFKDFFGVTIFGQGKDEHKAVVALAGNFNQEFILSLLGKEKGHKESRYGKYTIHNWGCTQFGVFAGDKLVLIGKDEEAVKAALDVFGGKKKSITGTKMMSYLKEIPKDAFLKVVADDISSIIGDHHQPVMLKKAGMAFFMALEKSENLKLKLRLTTDSPETAKSIEQIANGLVALVKLQQKEEAAKLQPLLDSLKISLKGNTIQMELSYPSEELVKMLSHHKDEHVHLDF